MVCMVSRAIPARTPHSWTQDVQTVPWRLGCQGVLRRTPCTDFVPRASRKHNACGVLSAGCSEMNSETRYGEAGTRTIEHRDAHLCTQSRKQRSYHHG